MRPVGPGGEGGTGELTAKGAGAPVHRLCAALEAGWTRCVPVLQLC